MRAKEDRPRVGTLLHEKDGDFNPGWLLVLIFAALGLVVSIGGLVVSIKDAKAGAIIVPSMLGYSAFGMICSATMVVSIGRAKILNNSRTLSSLAKSFRAGGGDVWLDNERDELWDAPHGGREDHEHD
jgi:hypothetical protein